MKLSVVNEGGPRGTLVRDRVNRFYGSVLEPLAVEDIPGAISLARRSYPGGLLDPCLKTIQFHEACLRAGLDDGRRLFKHVRHGQIVGVCGLHRYLWGPPEHAWLSWFFVDPELRLGFHAYRMLRSLLLIAAGEGLKRLYIETPSDDPDYAQAGRYLARLGFVQQAVLPDYYRPGVDMLVFVTAIGSGENAASASRREADRC